MNTFTAVVPVRKGTELTSDDTPSRITFQRRFGDTRLGNIVLWLGHYLGKRVTRRR